MVRTAASDRNTKNYKAARFKKELCEVSVIRTKVTPVKPGWAPTSGNGLRRWSHFRSLR